jgi:hypothetical protein
MEIFFGLMIALFLARFLLNNGSTTVKTAPT